MDNGFPRCDIALFFVESGVLLCCLVTLNLLIGSSLSNFDFFFCELMDVAAPEAEIVVAALTGGVAGWFSIDESSFFLPNK